MTDPEFNEAADILMAEIEVWKKPEHGYWMAVVTRAGDERHDLQVRVRYYPMSWRDLHEGQSIATNTLLSLGGKEWASERTKEDLRENFRDILKAIEDQYNSQVPAT